MSDPDFFAGDFELSEARVAVVGLGLMGGSLALALQGRCRERLGIDPDPAVRALAARLGAAERLSAEPGELLPEADLVVLAVPVGAILRLVSDLPALHPGRAVVIDLGSTKERIVQAMESLPERFEPLGGHPICGKERSSLAEADAALFREQAFAFTPSARTTKRARAAAEQLAAALDAHPLWLSTQTHDRLLAITSHAPYLIASALAGSVPGEALPAAGPGLCSTTRVASTPTTVMLDVLETNRENILVALASFRRRLDLLESELAAGDLDGLARRLEEGAAARRRLVDEPVREGRTV